MSSMPMPTQRYQGPSEFGKRPSTFRSQLNKEIQGECFMKVAIFTSIVAVAGIASSIACYYIGAGKKNKPVDDARSGRSANSSSTQAKDAERRQREEMARLQKLLAECRASRRGVSTPQKQYTGQPARVLY